MIKIEGNILYKGISINKNVRNFIKKYNIRESRAIVVDMPVGRFKYVHDDCEISDLCIAINCVDYSLIKNYTSHKYKYIIYECQLSSDIRYEIIINTNNNIRLLERKDKLKTLL